jgi:hypothetical protein
MLAFLGEGCCDEAIVRLFVAGEFKINLGPDDDMDGVGVYSLLKMIPKSLMHIAKLRKATIIYFGRQPWAIDLLAFSIEGKVSGLPCLRIHRLDNLNVRGPIRRSFARAEPRRRDVSDGEVYGMHSSEIARNGAPQTSNNKRHYSWLYERLTVNAR